MLARRSAFTLLEVLLTLSMSIVFMMLIGGAIQFYARDMNVRDMDIRQTQLAAAIMQMIEDDLRATLHSEPTDTSGLESLLAANASGGGEPSDDEAGSSDLSAAGIESADEAVVEETESLDMLAGATVLQSPGLIGNETQVQVDISRLPRLEEYMSMMDADSYNVDDVPSDVKTIAYFVQSAGDIGVRDELDSLGSEETSSSDTESGGLVRRSLDRAATAQASATGALSLLNQTGEIIATEVLAIQLAYWDGTTWQLQWSSDEYGELPLAVKVSLTMADPTAPPSETTAVRTYSHVVRLPLARPIDQTDSDTTSTETTEAG